MHTLICTLILTSSMLFPILTQPVLLASALIFQTILIAIFLSYLKIWYAFILILIFMGGMMIMILYIVSILPSSMSIESNKKWLIPLIGVSFSFIIFPFWVTNSPMTFLLNQPKILSKQHTLLELSLTNSNNKLLFPFVVMYLLFTLLVLIKILKKEKMPLRLQS